MFVPESFTVFFYKVINIFFMRTALTNDRLEKQHSKEPVHNKMILKGDHGLELNLASFHTY